MIKVLLDVWKCVKSCFRSKYKWMLILYLLWLYRLSFIQEDGGGFGKILQVVTIFGLLAGALTYFGKYNLISFSFCKTNIAIKSCLLLYLYGVISTFWAYLPQFAFFLAFQNIVLIMLCIWFFSRFSSFEKMEKAFLYLCLVTMIFEYVFYRIVVLPALFVHYLPNASSAAMMVSYCVGELFAAKQMTKERKKLLKSVCYFSLFILVTSTSSGANASAILGIAVSCLLSGKILWALLALIPAIVLYLNPNLLDDLILLIMPGKTRETIESATGRDIIWDAIKTLTAERPILGWGFGCVERIASDRYDLGVPDAHNNYIGLKGSLGIVGLILGILHFIAALLVSLSHRMKVGYVGLISAISCALLNGYSYGFLSGKACSITVIYIAVIVLTMFYSKFSKYQHFNSIA